jgi:hydroxymethylglutaryl-CoA lyase
MSLEIVEVGPRDGLQNEDTLVSIDDKVELIERSVAIGTRRIEAVSFVHPRAVPQMADAEAVMEALPRRAGVAYSGLVPNLKGLERALAAGVDEINVLVMATDTFSRRNQGKTTDEMLAECQAILAVAAAQGVPATVTIGAAFGCPFEGPVSIERVRRIMADVAVDGLTEISLADTIGVGVPLQVNQLADVARRQMPGVPLRFHFHNTRNTGYANAVAAVDAGAAALDASLGGLGGCRFAPDATGNVATEDLVYLLSRGGVDVSIGLPEAIAAGLYAASLVGHEPSSMLTRAGPFPSADPMPSSPST